MSAVTKSAVANAPSTMPQSLDHALRCQIARLSPPYEAWRTDYEIAASDLPSNDVREALQDRAVDIDCWMTPATGQVSTREYRMICASMAVPNVDDETAKMELAAFIEATSDLPTFALKQACQSFRLGRVGDGKWAPKPGEVRREALRLTHVFVKERREIKAVLDAKPRVGWVGSERRRASIEAGIAEAAKVRALLSKDAPLG